MVGPHPQEHLQASMGPPPFQQWLMGHPAAECQGHQGLDQSQDLWQALMALHKQQQACSRCLLDRKG
jgi:hypothetical protein